MYTELLTSATSNPKLKRRGTSHAPADVRRAQILEAAMRCFGDAGFARTTMDDLAEAAGLSKGSLYRFFASKDDVLLALFDSFNDLTREALAAEPPGDSPLDALEHVANTLLEAITGSSESLGAWLEFVAERRFRDRFAALYREARTDLSGPIREAVEAGTLNPVDPESAAAGLVALLEGLLLQQMMDPSFDVMARWPGAWAIFRRGLEKQPEMRAQSPSTEPGSNPRGNA